ncbi:unnamed protein product, partial [Scytosiphon promiscuus]
RNLTDTRILKCRQRACLGLLASCSGEGENTVPPQWYCTDANLRLLLVDTLPQVSLQRGRTDFSYETTRFMPLGNSAPGKEIMTNYDVRNWASVSTLCFLAGHHPQYLAYTIPSKHTKVSTPNPPSPLSPTCPSTRYPKAGWNKRGSTS